MMFLMSQHEFTKHHTRGKIMENKVRFKLHKVKKHWITIAAQVWLSGLH